MAVYAKNRIPERQETKCIIRNLTDAEIAERSEQNTERYHTIERLEQELKDTVKQLKSVIDSEKKALKQGMYVCRHKRIEEETELNYFLNVDTASWEICDVRTGELIDTKPLSPVERKEYSVLY